MLANLGLICANQDRDDAGALALLERADAGYTRVGTRGDARAQGAERATKEALQRVRERLALADKARRPPSPRPAAFPCLGLCSKHS